MKLHDLRKLDRPCIWEQNFSMDCISLDINKKDPNILAAGSFRGNLVTIFDYDTTQIKERVSIKNLNTVDCVKWRTDEVNEIFIGSGAISNLISFDITKPKRPKRVYL